jgi:hypothetical protein
VFKAVAGEALEAQRATLGEKFTAARQAYQADPRSRPRLDTLMAAANSLDAALATDASALFVALERAHAALRDALTAPELSFATLRARIETVAAEAQKLASLAAAFARATSVAGG